MDQVAQDGSITKQVIIGKELSEIFDAAEAVAVGLASGQKLKAVTDNLDKIFKAFEGWEKVPAEAKGDSLGATIGYGLGLAISAFMKTKKSIAAPVA